LALQVSIGAATLAAGILFPILRLTERTRPVAAVAVKTKNSGSMLKR
jgi:hypothetical protein